MKKLILVRHAKSDHTFEIDDFDRPLNERGHKDAPKMAKYLKENGIDIQHFVSSPAKRALTTCRYFAETYGNPKIQKEEDLYEPHPEDFENTILNLNDLHSSAALFSHNNGISDFASSLTEKTIQLPTCGVVIFEINCDEWSEFEGADKKLIHFFVPKEI